MSDALDFEALEADFEEEEFLAFRIKGELYCAHLRSIGEIVRPGSITRVPGARKDVRGIVSVRGRLVTVVDLRVSLGFERVDVSRSSRLMLLESEDDMVGYLVDAVENVLGFRKLEIEDVSVLGTAERPHILGIARKNGAVFVLLDLGVLSPAGAGSRDAARAAQWIRDNEGTP
jgi:purine-binding chemotaxis protein CheW